MSSRSIIGQILRDHESAWAKLIEINMERGRELDRAGQEKAAQSIITTIDGGDCVLCGVAWLPVEVKNRFAEYRYYRPNCKCFPICWQCGTQIIEERIINPGIKHCPNCKAFLYQRPRKIAEYWILDKQNEEAKEIEIQYHSQYTGRREEQDD